MNDDIEAHRDKLFCTNVRGRVPPLVTTPFTVKDDGKITKFISFMFIKTHAPNECISK